MKTNKTLSYLFVGAALCSAASSFTNPFMARASKFFIPNVKKVVGKAFRKFHTSFFGPPTYGTTLGVVGGVGYATWKGKNVKRCALTGGLMGLTAGVLKARDNFFAGKLQKLEQGHMEILKNQEMHTGFFGNIIKMQGKHTKRFRNVGYNFNMLKKGQRNIFKNVEECSSGIDELGKGQRRLWGRLGKILDTQGQNTQDILNKIDGKPGIFGRLFSEKLSASKKMS